MGASLVHANMIWDRVQVTIFLVQESMLSILYIHETQKHLRIVGCVDNKPKASLWSRRDGLLLHLIGSNLLIIVFDVTLLAIEYTGLKYLQAAFKPCVYGIKLKVEFPVLNRLVQSLEHRGSSSIGAVDGGRQGGNGSFTLVLPP